ncbi:MAG TPA: D-glycero-beta-D-manno-heptose 1-phosphate adenylyltransferase [Elusimicrobiota bacterium]|nr:D-glycero-beta-D-manno-heptose 1-phosphate adenylyltransferase [Elusimicrobiota bacterium]
MPSERDKIVFSWARLKRTLARLRKGKTVAFTNGCFDLFHAGHVRTLQTARRQGDVLVVGLNSDRSVRRLKGPSRPLVPQRDRATVMAALSCVDFVTVFNEETPARLIETIRPDVVVKGGDWSARDIVGRDVAKKVVRVPLVKGLSTTALIQKIRQRFRGR